MSCEGCHQEQKELNRQLENLIIQAKEKAIEENKPKAICYEATTSFFIADAYTAIGQNFQIRHIVSNL